MSTFEVYYVIRKEDKKQVDKIVAGPYYELLEAFDAIKKLENDHREYSFEVMTHVLKLIDGVIDGD